MEDCEYFPIMHIWQTVSPDFDVKVPRAHGKQMEADTADEYVPARHAKQLEYPA